MSECATGGLSGKFVHWNGYAATQFRPQGMLDQYLDWLRPFLMYRSVESVEDWEDAREKCGDWYDASSSRTDHVSWSKSAIHLAQPM